MPFGAGILEVVSYFEDVYFGKLSWLFNTEIPLLVSEIINTRFPLRDELYIPKFSSSLSMLVSFLQKVHAIFTNSSFLSVCVPFVGPALLLFLTVTVPACQAKHEDCFQNLAVIIYHPVVSAVHSIRKSRKRL